MESIMIKILRRIGLIVLTSSGVIAGTTLTAHALAGHNHCEPRLLR
jgi:hypothetical protein